MIQRTDVVTRFWSYVSKKGVGCWEWTGCKHTAGYGMINMGGRYGRIERAHRLSWIIHFGPIPDKLCVCHHCDNRKCVNPDHLFLGSRSDNNRDMKLKGRCDRIKRPRGERSGNSKLTESDIVNIRMEYSKTKPLLRELSVKYGVSPQQIYRIVTRKSWAHVP
jgi:hypothetical protein